MWEKARETAEDIQGDAEEREDADSFSSVFQILFIWSFTDIFFQSFYWHHSETCNGLSV